jgi:hypothetical protein
LFVSVAPGMVPVAAAPSGVRFAEPNGPSPPARKRIRAAVRLVAPVRLTVTVPLAPGSAAGAFGVSTAGEEVKWSAQLSSGIHGACPVVANQSKPWYTMRPRPRRDAKTGALPPLAQGANAPAGSDAVVTDIVALALGMIAGPVSKAVFPVPAGLKLKGPVGSLPTSP